MNEFDSLTFLAERKKYGAHMKMIIKEMVKSQTCQKHKDALSVGGDVRKDDNNMARKAPKGSSQMMVMMRMMMNMVTIWQDWLQRDDLGRRRGPTRRLARGERA